MELYHQLLALYFSQSERFEQEINGPAIVEGICYQMLCSIQTILSDCNNTDEMCFQKIEEIIDLFSKHGLTCGNRHDFG